jgi:hypothetical protein
MMKDWSMRFRSSATLVIAAALANALPSQAALHPRLTSPVGLNEQDLSGTGAEKACAKSTAGISRGETVKNAREWREMAARCRNFARWLDPEHRDVLLRLAEEYEGRAVNAEQGKSQA